MITRDVKSATSGVHDVIIIGGGIYGACTALEAARRGMRPLLIERSDFGGATSWNSLRIIHGGLRYLQSLDLKRFRQSVRERQWFLRTFPDLVRPMPCLMPLYGQGLKAPWICRGALAANDLLARASIAPAEQRHMLPRGRVLNMVETVSAFPNVDVRGLRGAGVWYDAAMISPQRVLIELLHWACDLGATTLNYVECEDIIVRRGRVCGVRARDHISGDDVEVTAPVVINCAGPWACHVAARSDQSSPTLFRPSLAFNLLLDRSPLSDAALAVSPRRPGGRVYFLYPFHGRVIAGTAHASWRDVADHPRPTYEQVGEMLDDLNQAVPGLMVAHDEVLRVYCGLLPSKQTGSSKLATRPTIFHHARKGGPKGLVSVSGVKYTTARLVAEQTLRRMYPNHKRQAADRPPRCGPRVDLHEPNDLLNGNCGRVRTELERMIEQEAVTSADDLLLRRTDWLADPRNAARVNQRLTELECSLPDAPSKAVDWRRFSRSAALKT